MAQSPVADLSTIWLKCDEMMYENKNNTPKFVIPHWQWDQTYFAPFFKANLVIKARKTRPPHCTARHSTDVCAILLFGKCMTAKQV